MLKPIIDFGKYKTAKNKEQTRNVCKPCRVINVSSIYRANPDIRKKACESARKSHLKNSYGITEDTYLSMMNAQNSKCAICETHYDSLNIDVGLINIEGAFNQLKDITDYRSW